MIRVKDNFQWITINDYDDCLWLAAAIAIESDTL